MNLQGKFLRFCNVWGNYKNILGSANRLNLPSCQQIAGIRQTVEEKYNIPPKPKRPLTPYFKFMAKIRPEVKRENPDANAVDIVRTIAAKWEKIDLQTKQSLESEYKKEQEVYTKERLNYDTKLTEDQKNILKQARVHQIESKEKRLHRKKCKENNKPKKPCTGFVLYMKSQLPNRGTKDFKEFQKETAAAWAALPDAQKKPFVDEMHKQMKDYQKAMVEWERKMIKLGNTDIVRHDALIEPTKPKPRPKKNE